MNYLLGLFLYKESCSYLPAVSRIYKVGRGNLVLRKSIPPHQPFFFVCWVAEHNATICLVTKERNEDDSFLRREIELIIAVFTRNYFLRCTAEPRRPHKFKLVNEALALVAQ